MLKRLTDWLALTGTERKVMWFLAATLAVGAGIRLYRATFPDAPAFEYRSSDSTFAALSERVNEAAIAPAPDASDARIDLNTADRTALMTLPGIGGVLADRIVQYRTAHGPFRSIEALAAVKGISKRKLQQLSPYLTLDNAHGK